MNDSLMIINYFNSSFFFFQEKVNVEEEKKEKEEEREREREREREWRAPMARTMLKRLTSTRFA